MLAAEAAFAAIATGRESDELTSYGEAVEQSWIASELKLVRNAQPAIEKFGSTLGTLVAGTDMWMRTLKIGLPFTMKHEPDHTKLWRKDQCAKIEYPKPDGIVSRSEEHKSELQSLMRNSYAVFCLNKKNTKHNKPWNHN